MITNERQHRITGAEIKRFEHAITRAEHDGPEPGVDRRLHRAMIAGMRSQLKELRDDLREYEALREGKIKKRIFRSLLDVPDALIEGRIAGRLTQKELGHRLGVPEQQVQRYERTRYSGVSIERLQEVAEALGIKLRKTVEYDVRPPAQSKSAARPGIRRGSERGMARPNSKAAARGLGGGTKMAGRKTGKAAASAAGKTLASKSAGKTARKAAASDLAQVGNRKTTGKKAASAAGRTLASKTASKTARKAAASDLSQAARKKKR